MSTLDLRIKGDVPYPRMSGTQSPPDSLKLQIAEVLEPVFNDIKSDLQSLKDIHTDPHQTIMETLKRIETQTTKTNGRVSELEKKEELNKYVRGGLYTFVSLILLAVAGKWLTTLQL